MDTGHSTLPQKKKNLLNQLFKYLAKEYHKKKKKKSKLIHLCVIFHLEGKDSNTIQNLPTWLLLSYKSLGKCRGNGVHHIIFCRKSYKHDLLWDKAEKASAGTLNFQTAVW